MSRTRRTTWSSASSWNGGRDIWPIYASSGQVERAGPMPDPPYSLAMTQGLRPDHRLAGLVRRSVFREIWSLGVGNDQMALCQLRIAHAVHEIEHDCADHIPGEEDQHSRLYREDKCKAAHDSERGQ